VGSFVVALTQSRSGGDLIQAANDTSTRLAKIYLNAKIFPVVGILVRPGNS